MQPAQVNRLALILQKARKQGGAFAVIDTSPDSESASLAAARAADLVLIPCRPHLLDLKAIGSSIELARLAKSHSPSWSMPSLRVVLLVRRLTPRWAPMMFPLHRFTYR